MLRSCCGRESTQALDPLRPESLMYDWDAPEPTLQGAMFIMEDVASMGPMIGGCLTTWRMHDNLCYTGDPLVDGTIVGFSDKFGGCPSQTMLRVTPEMLHVWIIPRPGGPFEGIET